MKRTALPFLLAAIIAIVLGFSCQRDPSIEADTFETELRGAAQHGGFTVVNKSAVNSEEVPLPVSIEWHPRRWRTSSANAVAAADRDRADHFGLLRDRASRVDCYVRYLDGRAQYIAIRPISDDTLTATDLRGVLAQQFPNFPIKIELR